MKRERQRQRKRERQREREGERLTERENPRYTSCSFLLAYYILQVSKL